VHRHIKTLELSDIFLVEEHRDIEKT